MEDKKTLKRFIKPALAITAAVLLLTALFAAFLPDYSVLVTGSDSRFYRGKKILLFGNTLICIRDSESHRTRRDALGVLDPDYTLALIPVNEVKRIEIVWESPAEDQDLSGIPGKYIGGYRIVASGHKGVLNLFVSKGKLYGSVKFPEWGNGVWEYLKYIRISNKRITFTRSITTAKELKRTGAGSYFIQRYSGSYTRNGKVIKGIYTVRGTRNQWEAVRIR
jgi:hypothetical protein